MEHLPQETIVFVITGGLLSLILAEIFRLPSIIFYLLVGIVFGPSVLGFIHPDSLGEIVPVGIELAVAIIVFEGSMSLNFTQFKQASKLIGNILSIGALITAVSMTLLAHYLIGLSFGVSLLFGVIMSVTGPTVIGPILKRVPLKKPLDSILNWESIMLEPIGAVLAVLILEFLVLAEVTLVSSFIRFFQMLVVGSLVGGAGGYALSFFLKRKNLSNESLRNLLVLGSALFIFGNSNLIVEHSGLAAVVAMGLIMGHSKIPYLDEIKHFKETITVFLISSLFVLLAAKLDLSQFFKLELKHYIFLFSVIFVVRPLSIFLSTRNSDLNTRSKIFLSLIAPRGIVAASLASLYALVFQKHGSTEAGELEILAYQVIATTVLLQGLWAPLLARLLKVREAEKKGYFFVGAHALSRGIAKWLQEKNQSVVLIDRDFYEVFQAKKLGLEAYKGDALDRRFVDNLPLNRIGNLLALTSNDEVNALACQVGRKLFGKDKVYQMNQKIDEEAAGEFVQSSFGKLVFPEIESLLSFLEYLDKGDYTFQEIKAAELKDEIPLFIQNKNEFIPALKDQNFKDDSILLVLKKTSA